MKQSARPQTRFAINDASRASVRLAASLTSMSQQTTRMIKLTICVLIVLASALLSGGCKSVPRKSPSPQYAGIVTKAGDVSGSIGQARSDSKEVKRLQSASLTVLDQLDSKLIKLLQK